MSRERKHSSKLAQSRRQTRPEEEDLDNEAGPAIIDDSGSEVNSDDDLHVSGSDNDDDEEEDEDEEQRQQKGVGLSKQTVKSPPTSESHDPFKSVESVDLSASNGSVRPLKVTDTTIIMNGFKGVPGESVDGGTEAAVQFDEMDDSISFEPLSSDKKYSLSSSNQAHLRPLKRVGRPDKETFWQRRNREKEEYRKRLEDPTFTPYVGDFFMHDSRRVKREFDSLNQPILKGRGRGRGRGHWPRGSGVQREVGRSDVQQEAQWNHDGFEELEPRPSSRTASLKGKARSQTSSIGRQTPQHGEIAPGSESRSTPQDKSQALQQGPSRTFKDRNLVSLTSSVISINISFPNSKRLVKDVTLTSYVGRIPYQKPLRGDRPVIISSIEGAGIREIYPSKDRSWLPYFLKNATNVNQGKESVHSRVGSVVRTGTPNDISPVRSINGIQNKVPPSAVHPPTFNQQSPAASEDEEDKPTKIKVNLPQVTNTTSASPAVSDSSSLHVHHPRPTKQINIADIDDSSARLKAFLNPQTVSSPPTSHERTSSAALPETAVHAAPFQPSTFAPPQQPPQQAQQVPNPFPPSVPFYYAPFAAIPPEFSQQNPYLLAQPPRYEVNGMVYYYDPPYYYIPPPPTRSPLPAGTNPSGAPQQSEQPDPAAQSQQMYYYQMPVQDPQRSMGMYFPYQQT